ncbi:DAAK1 [Auxenochlorella protothecoides x Auxenochlorella symbiontica]|uniref:UMP-CMP kinase n=1 Tax=Auxenochlorella protothecoides TaxID=3075 RepID=A0A1D1ZZM6_AUXPR
MLAASRLCQTRVLRHLARRLPLERECATSLSSCLDTLGQKTSTSYFQKLSMAATMTDSQVPAAAAAAGKSLATKKIVFVLGGPGSGKGTQSGKLVKEFGAVHLSAGDLLRAHMKSGTPDGQMVADMIANGRIVPSHVTVTLLKDAMEASDKSLFLIDGFPRNEENRAAFEKQLSIAPVLVLFFDCSEEVMMERLLGRQEGRTDDNIETIHKRFKVFTEQSLPVVEHYEALSKVARIDAHRDPEEVYREVRRLFEEL